MVKEDPNDIPEEIIERLREVDDVDNDEDDDDDDEGESWKKDFDEA